jgi:hypothetical protein
MLPVIPRGIFPRPDVNVLFWRKVMSFSAVKYDVSRD